MNIIKSTRAALKIESIKGPIKKIGDYSDIFRAKYLNFFVKNDSNQAFGQKVNNNFIVYHPLVCVLTNEGMIELVKAAYGAMPLKDCSFIHFNKVKGKDTAVYTITVEDSIIRFIQKINEYVFKKIINDSSTMIEKIKADMNLSTPTHFPEYINDITRSESLNFHVDYTSPGTTSFTLLLFYYNAISFKCKEVDLDGKARGNTAVRVECY